MLIAKNPPQSKETPVVTEIKPSSPSIFKQLKPYMPLLVVVSMLILLPIVGLAVKLSHDLRSRASETIPVPVRVEINPGEIILPRVTSSPVSLSALAYDKNNQPIWSGVMYNWGISSLNSIGTVISHNDLATFYPLHNGVGDLYVTAYTSTGQAQRSVYVAIGPVSTPTPIPIGTSPSPVSSIPPPTPISSVVPSPVPSTLPNFCAGKVDGTACTITQCPSCAPGVKICPKFACKITNGVCQKQTCVEPASSISPKQ